MIEQPAAATAHAIPYNESALRSAWSHLRFWMAAVLLLLLDLGSKHWAFSRLGHDETVTMVPGFLEFRRSLNDGAVFGSLTGRVELFIGASILALGFVFCLFCGSSRRGRVLHVALGMILAGTLGNLYDRAVQIADIVTYKTASGREITVIGRIVSSPESAEIRIGPFPEGIDPQHFLKSEVQVRRQGVVRDFIKLAPKFPSWVPRLARNDVWPWIFNVADSALVCGVGLLLLTSWRDRRAMRVASPDGGS